ncbi:MAG: hypothetical protein U9R79_02740 [Armatimonadota bacterium]|nr:hypothetical protein [Armatimonadota bacterium]
MECRDPDAPLEPCTAGAIHCYAAESEAEALALSAMMDLGHRNYGKDVRVWRFYPEGEVRDGGDKAICRAGSIGEELRLPQPTTEQRVELGIRAALVAYREPAYVEWAEGWLSGADRSQKGAKAAWQAAAQMGRDGADATAWAALHMARAIGEALNMARAAKAAARAARAARAAVRAAEWGAAARAAEWGAEWTLRAAWQAGRAAVEAAREAPIIDLAGLALAVLQGRGDEWSAEAALAAAMEDDEDE